MGVILLYSPLRRYPVQTERLQGDVEMTVDDMLRLLREGGGLERLSRDASAVSALCWHYCRSRRGKL